MTGWIIAAAIAALIVLLLCLHAGVKIHYNEEGFTVFVKYGLLKVRIVPSKKKKKKTVKTKTEEKEKHRRGGIWNNFSDIVRLVSDALCRLRHKLVINRLELNLAYGDEDAAKTAIAYGVASSALGNIVPIIENTFRLKKRNFVLTPVFDRKTLEVIMHAELSISLGSLIWIALVLLFKFAGTKVKK